MLKVTETKRRQSHPELYILLFLGVKPKVLEKHGYSMATIYKYNGQIPRIKEKINKLLCSSWFF